MVAALREEWDRFILEEINEIPRLPTTTQRCLAVKGGNKYHAQPLSFYSLNILFCSKYKIVNYWLAAIRIASAGRSGGEQRRAGYVVSTSVAYMGYHSDTAAKCIFATVHSVCADTLDLLYLVTRRVGHKKSRSKKERKKRVSSAEGKMAI